MSMLLLLHTAKQLKIVPRWLCLTLVSFASVYKYCYRLKIILFNLFYFTLNTPESEDIFVTRQTKNSPVYSIKKKNSKNMIN